MLEKKITYTDYDGNERTETHYFNLTKPELMEMEFSVGGGLDKKISKIIETQDTTKLMDIFKDLIIRSYGIKSDDGKRFIKKAEITEEFTQTGAYSELYMELATDADAAATFVNGIMPKDLMEAANKKAAIAAK